MPIYDITLPVSPDLVVWPDDPPIQMTHAAHLERGDLYTLTRLDISAHTGSHLDAPAHFIPGGKTVEQLDLDILVGPALLIDAGGAAEITAGLLDSLAIPPGIQRLLVRTRNSELWRRGDMRFHEDFVAISADGARWLLDRGVRLIGVDYLSVSPWNDLVTPHQILLGAGVIPVEGLNLSGIAPGLYQLICLPVKLAGSDGAPVRAILIES